MTTPIRLRRLGDPAPAMAAQLDLFPAAPAQDVSQVARGLDLDVARASVSPGWWPILRPILADPEVVVRTCREREGELVLELEAIDGNADPLILAEVAERLRALVAARCGCCGEAPARARRRTLDGPTRTACDACWQRLVRGEAYLSIADCFFALDGTRRAQPLVPRNAIGSPSPAIRGREPTALPPDELRALVVALYDAVCREITGQDDAVADAALLGALHVGGGLVRGARALVIGPSGSGKSTLLACLKRALDDAGWRVPWAVIDATQLSSPGWTGLSAGGAIAAALGTEPPTSPRAAHAVVVVDEIHHIGRVEGTHGNMTAKRDETLASMLGLFGDADVPLGERGEGVWSSRQALVIGVGAFTGLMAVDRPPSVDDLVRAGMPLELASRFRETVIILRPLAEAALVELLRRWPALIGLTAVCERLGYPVRITDEAYRRAARVLALGCDSSTPRTAGAWLVAALRRALRERLLVGLDANDEIVIAPDSLDIPVDAIRPKPPDEPPDDGGWDVGIVITRR